MSLAASYVGASLDRRTQQVTVCSKIGWPTVVALPPRPVVPRKRSALPSTPSSVSAMFAPRVIAAPLPVASGVENVPSPFAVISSNGHRRSSRARVAIPSPAAATTCPAVKVSS